MVHDQSTLVLLSVLRTCACEVKDAVPASCLLKGYFVLSSLQASSVHMGHTPHAQRRQEYTLCCAMIKVWLSNKTFIQ